MSTRLAALLLVLCVTLGQRVYVDLGGGILDVFAVGFVGVATLIWIRDSSLSVGPSPYRALMLNTVGPFLALLVVLPLIAVLVGYADPRHLYVWIVPAMALGILSLARAQRVRGFDLATLGYVMILVHGVYGLGQTLYRLGMVPSGLWGPMVDWDTRSQLELSGNYSILSRSTGLFINANQFGMWSALAVVFSAIFLRGRRQAIGLFLGVAGVIGSQSRTAWAALGLLAVVLLARALRDTRVTGRVLGGLLICAPLLVIAWLLGLLPRLVESQLVERLQSGLGVFGGGVAADPNLEGRVVAWADAWRFSSEYPFGTLGPPERLFGSFIDNEYVALFLQGSVLLVAAYVLALLSPLVLARRAVPHARSLWAMSTIVALSSVTMLPVEGIRSAALGWLAGAAAVGSVRVAAKEDHRPGGRHGVKRRSGGLGQPDRYRARL